MAIGNAAVSLDIYMDFHILFECRKCNGTVAEVKKIIKIINDSGKFPLSSEVLFILCT